MPISVSIEANSPEEYKALIAALTAGKVEQSWQTAFTPAPLPEPEPEPEVEPSATEDVTAEAAAAADAPPVQDDAPAPKKRGRKPKGTPSEYPSPNQPTASTEPPTPEMEPVADDEGSATPEEAEDLFAPDTSAPASTAKADMEKALEELRVLYDRPGVPAKANDLLATYNVKKFSLIPEEKGTELLAIVRQLAKDNPA